MGRQDFSGRNIPRFWDLRTGNGVNWRILFDIKSITSNLPWSG
jgi:hypothetical protein